MYYYGGYSGGYNTGSSCGCSNAMNYSYPSYGYGYGNYDKILEVKERDEVYA